MESAATRFGQRLAHTEKKYRDQALKKLKLYLTRRDEWTEMEWDKLWKALFYCMWMSDKRPVQEELSTNLAGLIHQIPSVDLALAFVHSFLRTMHREWHGIDGLRLDKYYSLIRKFVHQSFLQLQRQGWQHEHVERFVSMMSTEIISQLPNGLRMHVCDLYLPELCAAAGQDSALDTPTFLHLLEPFFTLLSSEYDKAVFKRVREMVFLPMLNDYEFGAKKILHEQGHTEKASEGEDDETENESDEEDVKAFVGVTLAHVQHRVFQIASADDTAERNRSVLYDLYGQFFQVTKVDSLKAAQEMEKMANEAKDKAIKSQMKKRKAGAEKEEEVKDKTLIKQDKTAEETAVKVSAEENKKKRKKRKKTADQENQQSETMEKKDLETHNCEPISKKGKDVEIKPHGEKDMSQVAKTKEKREAEKKKTTKAVAEDKKVNEDKKGSSSESVGVASGEKYPRCATCGKGLVPKGKDRCAHCIQTGGKKSASTSANKSPKEVQAKPTTVTKSGKSFPRCTSCGGFGKGLIPKGQNLCAHCARTSKVKKKGSNATSKSKKRKAQVVAVDESEEVISAQKRVTFGKSKALPYALSVKRLKASAKKTLASENSASASTGSSLKKRSVVESEKTKTTTSKTKKSRKKAADFF